MNELIKELLQIENQLTELYKKKNELVSKFPQEFPQSFTAFQNEDGTWTRLSVIDNAEKLNEGFFKTVRVERFNLKVETLKNMPKELKEAMK